MGSGPYVDVEQVPEIEPESSTPVITTTETSTWDIEQLIEFAGAAEEIAATGQDNPAGHEFNTGELLAAIGAGAGAGAAVGAWVGAIVGAVVGALIYCIGHWLGQSGVPAAWHNSANGVHGWFTMFGPQAYLDWMRVNAPDAFGSLDACIKGLFLWGVMEQNWFWREGASTYGNIPDNWYIVQWNGQGAGDGGNGMTQSFADWMPNQSNPSNEAREALRVNIEGRANSPTYFPPAMQRLRDMYRAIGVDYDSTVAHRNDGGTGWIMYGVRDPRPYPYLDLNDPAGLGDGSDGTRIPPQKNEAGEAAALGVGLYLLSQLK